MGGNAWRTGTQAWEFVGGSLHVSCAGRKPEGQERETKWVRVGRGKRGGLELEHGSSQGRISEIRSPLLGGDGPRVSHAHRKPGRCDGKMVGGLGLVGKTGDMGTKR